MRGRRYALLDTIRGAAMGNMIAYHAVWDLVYLCGMDWAWYRGYGAYFWQQAICWTFLLLSGFCQQLGWHRIRRGLVISASGALVSAVTAIVVPEGRIIFGVLTLIGCCTLLAAALDRWLSRCRPGVGLTVCGVLFVVTKAVPHGFLGLLDWQMWRLPDGWYANLATAFLGFPPNDFYSADYFPLLPWVFLFFAGYFLFGLVEKHGWLDRLAGGNLPLFSWMGRHSLAVYLVHQPILYGLLTWLFSH